MALSGFGDIMQMELAWRNCLFHLLSLDSIDFMKFEKSFSDIFIYKNYERFMKFPELKLDSVKSLIILRDKLPHKFWPVFDNVKSRTNIDLESADIYRALQYRSDYMAFHHINALSSSPRILADVSPGIVSFIPDVDKFTDSMMEFSWQDDKLRREDKQREKFLFVVDRAIRYLYRMSDARL
jgi:hypothetical protein